MKSGVQKALWWVVGGMLVQMVMLNTPFTMLTKAQKARLSQGNPSFTPAMAAKGGYDLYDLWRINYAPKGQLAGGLSPDQTFLAFAGMRELVASILWVRADNYFDQGNYDAILPIIRIVTWLDPHQLDVYSTGMWHIGYNFTDEESRSDRRYLPTALALGKEGSSKNPETYELFFESGWLWFHKINDNHEKAVKWLEQARTRKDIIPARGNILGMAYQRNGEPEKGLALYYEQLDKAQKRVDASKDDYQSRVERDTIEQNIDTTIIRMSQRGVFEKKNGTHSPVKSDVDPPFNVGFTAQISVVSPRIIRIVGTYGVKPVGTRIRVILRDEDYPNVIPGGANWDAESNITFDPPRDKTYMQDELFVRNQRFDKRIDLSRDPTMYSFVKDKYLLEFFYSPRVAPPHIQDRFGWSGEGFTDSNYLSTTARPNSRVLYCSFPLTRDMIEREGEWLNKVPVITTQGYVDKGAKRYGEEEIILVPGLRN